MADTKVSALTADTTPSSDDLIYTVNDPGGTPASRKVTIANLAANMPAMTVAGVTSTSSDSFGNGALTVNAVTGAIVVQGDVTAQNNISLLNTKGLFQRNSANTGWLSAIDASGDTQIFGSQSSTGLYLDSGNWVQFRVGGGSNGFFLNSSGDAKFYSSIESEAALPRLILDETDQSIDWYVSSNAEVFEVEPVGADSTFTVLSDARAVQFSVATATGNTDVAGDLTVAGDFNLASPTVPASASATGTAGDIAWDSDYIYVCTATNTWERVAIATW